MGPPARGAALAALTAATLLWGINFPVMKHAVAEVDAFFIAGLRICFGAAAFYALLDREDRRRLFGRGMLGRLLLLSLTGIVMNQTLVLLGLERTTPGHSAVLMALIPIFVALIALAWLRERLTAAGWIGILFGAAGASGVVASTTPGGEATLGGDALTLAATFAFAVYTVLGRELVQGIGARRLLAASYLGALPAAFVLLAAGYERQAARPELGTGGIAAVAYVLVVNTVVCYLLYFWALRALRAAEVAIFSNFQPVLGTALSVAAGMEGTIGPAFVASALVVLLGVWLVQVRGAPKTVSGQGYTPNDS